MSVRRKYRPNGPWMIDIDTTKFPNFDSAKEPRIRRVSPVNTRKGAEEYHRQVVGQLLDGTWGKEEKKAPFFGNYAPEYMERYCKPNNKPGTYKTNDSYLRNHLIPFFGSRRLEDIQKPFVDDFKAEQVSYDESDRHKKTINNMTALLRKMLVEAKGWGYLDSLPEITKLKIPKYNKTAVTEDEYHCAEDIDMLLAVEMKTWVHNMIQLLVHTGLRIGELRALQPKRDINFDGRVLMVNKNLADGSKEEQIPKGNATRAIPLNNHAMLAIKHQAHLKGPYLFCNEDGSPLSRNQVTHPVYRMCAKAGIKELGPHALRHTFASILAMNGVRIEVIQKYLGHTDIKMTMRYAHLSPGFIEDSIKVLDSVWHHDGTHGSKTNNSQQFSLVEGLWA